MATAKVTSKGQITIPQEIREALSLKAGDRVDFFIVDGSCQMMAKNKSIKDLCGVIKTNTSVSVEDMEEAIADGFSDRTEKETTKKSGRKAV